MAKNYKFEIGNHPSQARHPFTNEPLVDDDGNPVPLFPDQQTLRLDGQVIGYIANNKVQFIICKRRLGTLYFEGLKFVEEQLGKPERVSVVPDMKDIIENDDD